MGMLHQINLLLRRFRGNESGLSAIEFAFIFPILIALYMGSVEVTHVLSIDRKVTSIASTTADLVAQSKAVNNGSVQDIFLAASQLIKPFEIGSLSIVVTSVVADENNATTVAWSDALNGTARTPGTPVTVPNGITQANTSVIFTEVTYPYNSIIGHFISGTIDLTDQFYLRPRNSNVVERE